MKAFPLLVMAFAGFLAFPCHSAKAGGSFSIDDVLPLLQQKPSLHEFVMLTFELDSIGWATRIGSRVNEHLGGARIAPYSIQVKKKGSAGAWEFYLEIEAETIFLDAAGKEVPLEKGKSIQEKLTGIRLVPIPVRQNSK